MPYLAKLERAGIPTVVIDFADLDEMVKQEALENGVPNIRFLHASRTILGPEDVDSFIESLIGALTTPLTEQEKETGQWESPQPRILFEGTLDEAQTFYQQTIDIPFPINAPLAVFTDGLPIIVPTEEKVREMLTGTNHKPDEVIAYQSDREGTVVGDREVGERKKGTAVRFLPTKRRATVEQVAVNAVMAGCKPEHLPVVLAIAESGVPVGSTGMWGQYVCLSGPIVKALKMNTSYGMMDPGSPASMPIGRAYQLMAINLGGAMLGINRMTFGHPFNSGGTCFAENADGLPPGWKGLNEESGYGKNESMVMCMNTPRSIQCNQFSPGGYRSLQKSGHGGIARRLDVKGIPGPHNWLEYLVPSLWAANEGSWTFIMVPEMARHLYEYGFKSKDEVSEWLWKQSFIPVKEYRKRSWADLSTNGWMGIEVTSGKRWKELDDDYMVPAGGNDPSNYCIIIGGGDEEVCAQFGGPRRELGGYPVYSIDAWR
ncbi:hypothetical protein ACFLWR_06345 [Chloroflexota bacterium]